LPATAYLEMLHRAGAEVFGAGQHTIDAIRFDEALVLTEDEQNVQVVLTPESDDEMRFEICRREADKWHLLASGRLHRASELSDTGVPATFHDSISAIQERCVEPLPADSFYELFRKQGIEHGPIFRGLVQIQRRTGEALAEVVLTESAANDLTQYHCHPALLDAALQVVITGMDDFVRGAQTHSYIPIAMERVRWYRQPTRRFWTHATIEPTSDGALAK